MTSEARGEALLALAARCEKDTGADNVLNRAIARAVGWGYQTPSEARRKNPAWFHPDDCRNGQPVLDSLHGTDVWREPLQYLTSLDAALSLIPETEYSLTNLYGVARAHVEMGNEYGGHHGSNECNSMPLAVCAAMLRALAYREETNP